MEAISILKRQVVLSPMYAIPPTEEIVNFHHIGEEGMEELELLQKEELFFLTRVNGGRFLINPVIKLFIESFQNPSTLEDVILHFAKESNSQPNQIQKVMTSFFDSLFKKGILVFEKDAKNLKDILEKESLLEAKYTIGDFISDYKVLKEVSIRKVAQLYLCKHPQQSEPVVLKLLILPDQLPEIVKENAKNKFAQEFKIMNELSGHKNICNLVEYNATQLFASIEYIEGESLRQFINENELSIDKKVEIIFQLLKAIAFVQQKKIIHGDIHLSNFLIKEEGEVKLIDFGMSNHELPEENEIVSNGGVYECIPPERVKVKGFSFLRKNADYRSEVFQMGVLIFYVLYRRYPFLGFTWKKLAESIQNDRLEYSKRTIEGEAIPSYVILMLEKAMQKNPKERFKDVNEMLSFLKNEVSDISKISNI